MVPHAPEDQEMEDEKAETVRLQPVGESSSAMATKYVIILIKTIIKLNYIFKRKRLYPS